MLGDLSLLQIFFFTFIMSAMAKLKIVSKAHIPWAIVIRGMVNYFCTYKFPLLLPGRDRQKEKGVYKIWRLWLS